MSESPGYSRRSTDQESEKSQSHIYNSIFSRIYNLFWNGPLNELYEEKIPKKILDSDSSNKGLIISNGIPANKGTKSLSSKKKSKLKNDRLNNENNTYVNLNLFRPIKRPVLKSLNLSNSAGWDKNNNYASNKVTYEGKKYIKPHIIQLGTRKAIRINPNSSASSISLSLPDVPIPPFTAPILPPEIPVSPATNSLSPPAVSISPSAMSFSPPTVPISPPVAKSHLQVLETTHVNSLSPSQDIPISNTSTPFRSRSRMIKVNTIADLDEVEGIHKDTQDNKNTSSVQEQLIAELELSRPKEKKKKRKKSKDGQKRKKRREMLRNEDGKVIGLDESNHKVGSTEAESNAVKGTRKSMVSSNIINIYNPFHTMTNSGENKGLNVTETQEYIESILGNDLEDINDKFTMSSNSRTEFVTNKKANSIHSASHESQFGPSETTLQSPNAEQKETDKISKLFMSSDIDSEEDRVILTYRNKSQQYSDLKWPGHDSICDVASPSQPITPNKEPSKDLDGNKNTKASIKPRLLSEIMAEKYEMDGILFLGKFRTTHIPSTTNSQLNDEFKDIRGKKQNSPIYKKFGIDVQKERFRG